MEEFLVLSGYVFAILVTVFIVHRFGILRFKKKMQKKYDIRD
jgi:purine-cytosine permease-like protein